MNKENVNQPMRNRAILAMQVGSKVCDPHCVKGVNAMMNDLSFDELVMLWDGVGHLLGGDEWQNGNPRIDLTARFVAAGILAMPWKGGGK